MAIVKLILLLILGGALDWLVITGLVWLIALCFGWEFTLGIATGVWIIKTVILWIISRIKNA